MIQYFCKECALKLGYYTNIDLTNDFTGSIGSYKFEKFIKHTTMPTTGSGTVSKFRYPDSDSYNDYIIDTATSGSIEIDNSSRVNILWYAAKETGDTFDDGVYIHCNDSVKLVLHDNELKIHPFPTGSNGFREAYCMDCGKILFI